MAGIHDEVKGEYAMTDGVMSATTGTNGHRGAGGNSGRRPMTLTQKILAQHAVGLTRPWVQTGDMLQIRVDWSIASELAWNGMDRTYTLLGRPALANPDRFYLALDHTVDRV